MAAEEGKLPVLNMGTSKNALFPRLRRQLRAPILRYHLYTAVVRAVLPCTHGKITIFRGAHMLLLGPVNTNYDRLRV